MYLSLADLRGSALYPSRPDFSSFYLQFREEFTLWSLRHCIGHFLFFQTLTCGNTIYVDIRTYVLSKNAVPSGNRIRTNKGEVFEPIEGE